MHSQPPFNPYAPTPTANGDQVGHLRERVAKLEGHLPHLAEEVSRYGEQMGTLWTKLHTIEQAGAEAIRHLPEVIGTHLAPLTSRLEKLEARWWEPMRPYLWRIYLGIAILGFAWGWKRVTGEPVPLRILIDAVLKSF